MKIDIKSIDDEIIIDLFPPCKTCIYWEAPRKFNEIDKGSRVKDDAVEIKRAWFERTQRTFGCCGKILYVDGKAAAYSQYALPNLLENVKEYSEELFPTSEDAVLISCLFVKEGYRERGIGVKLLQAVLADLKNRNFKAVETYARDDSSNNCSGPTNFYLKNGFTALKSKKWEKVPFSLMRKELKNE